MFKYDITPMLYKKHWTLLTLNIMLVNIAAVDILK